MKLLVVDDSDDARVLQQTLLASKGYQVSTAENGLEALDRISQSRPDLIISDILMPLMDGYELCRKIKADNDLKEIPIVFYSAHYLDVKDKKMAEDLGVKYLIKKPMEPSDFLRAITDILLETQADNIGSPKKDDAELKHEHEQRLTEMLYGKLEELEKSQKMLKKALKGTITTVSLAVEARDPYTAGHQRRVAELACAIAELMGLNADQIEGIQMGAIIHDIGKIQLPAEILGKPGKFSDLEYAIVKEHSLIGYGILKDVDFPWPVANIAHQHHERLDGSGYPQGLKGEKICLEARIVAVADVVEAMASHRPYRPSLGIDAALGEIKTNRETLYDPAVVDACLKTFSEKQFSFQDH